MVKKIVGNQSKQEIYKSPERKGFGMAEQQDSLKDNNELMINALKRQHFPKKE